MPPEQRSGQLTLRQHLKETFIKADVGSLYNTASNCSEYAQNILISEFLQDSNKNMYMRAL